MSQNRWKIRSLGLGVGLRTVHYSHILEKRPAIDFFEIVSENYMDVEGRPMWTLDQIAERHPIVMHGVSMSIGSTDPLDMDYLVKLKALARRVNAPIVSDHLCFTGVAGRNVHDLLPVPYDEKTLRHVVARVKQVQDVLERPLMLENPSTYLEFKTSTMSEPEFMVRLMEQADCGMLLDVNNVYVSSRNHGFDAIEYLDAIPVDRIAYHHLAGHTDKGTHLLDTHSDHVIAEVWDLYQHISNRTGGRTTLVEWDENIPEFDVVHAEVLKARQYAGKKAHAAA